MRPRRRPWRWRPSAPDGHRRSPDPPRARSPALGTLPRHRPRHRPRLSPLPRPRLSPRRLSTPPRNRPHRDGQRQDAGAAIARKDGKGNGYLGGAPGGLNPAVWRRRPATAGVCGGHRYQGPFAAAKRPLWPSSRNVNCGVDQPPGYEGKKHRPLHRTASVWAKRRLAAGTVASRFSQSTGPATATARDTCARACDHNRGGGAGSGARRPSGFAQGGGVRAAAQTRGPGPFAS